MKTVLCIVDGMTDSEFNLANMPALEKMAHDGATGILHTTPPGFLPGTLPCICSLLGVPDEAIAKTGRGWVEALGSGLHIAPDDIAFRTSWISLAPDGTSIGFCPHPPHTAKAVEGTSYYPLQEYAGILVVHGGANNPAYKQVRTMPPHMKFGQDVELVLPKGAKEIEAFSAANRSDDLIAIPWSGGRADERLHFPFKSAMISSTMVVKGIGRILEMEVLQGERSTGDVDTDLEEKYKLCCDTLEKVDFVVLHFGGPDEASHRKNRAEKEEFLRRVDAEVIGPLSRQNIQFAVCSDHSTDPVTGAHGGEPQPYFVVGSPCREKGGELWGGGLLELLGLPLPQSL